MKNKKLMCFICIAILLIFPAHINASYDTNYYERYNPAIKQLSTTPYAKHINFLIKSGKLKADGVVYTLICASDISFNQKILEKYDLQTVVIRIGDKYYKTKPLFKRLFFVKRGKKGIFRYILSKELILVYVPYADKIQVIGVISQGQFIRENRIKEYDLNISKEIKEQILSEIFNLLGCRRLKSCHIKGNIDSNSYFYKGNKLIGVMENFGKEKVLIRIKDDNKKHIATIKEYEDKVLMEDMQGNILYESDYSKKIDIKLHALDYEILLKIR